MEKNEEKLFQTMTSRTQTHKRFFASRFLLFRFGKQLGICVISWVAAFSTISFSFLPSSEFCFLVARSAYGSGNFQDGSGQKETNELLHEKAIFQLVDRKFVSFFDMNKGASLLKCETEGLCIKNLLVTSTKLAENDSSFN